MKIKIQLITYVQDRYVEKAMHIYFKSILILQKYDFINHNIK